MAGDQTAIPPLESLISLSGRTAIVTGGARGIGAAIVHRFNEAGATTFAVDTAQPAGGADPDSLLSHDVTDPSASEVVAQTAIDRTGRLDIWVNNAGVYPSAPLLEMTDAAWQTVLDLNLTAAFRGGRAAARAMADAGKSGGVIVNIVSNAGMAAGPASAHYVASKHGLAGLTKSMAVDLAPHGIRAVGVAPGVTRSDGLVDKMAELEAAGWGDLDDYAARTIPLGRMADPDEIARVVLFAASDLAAYISGTTIVADGGQLTSFT